MQTPTQLNGLFPQSFFFLLPCLMAGVGARSRPLCLASLVRSLTGKHLDPRAARIAIWIFQFWMAYLSEMLTF